MSETDFTDDLERFDVPTLVMHGEDDQIVPFADSRPLSASVLDDGPFHDLLNDIGKEKAMGDVIEWLDARLPKA